MQADFDPDLKNSYELADLKIRSARLMEKCHQFFFIYDDHDAIPIMHACKRLEKVCGMFLNILQEEMTKNLNYSEMERNVVYHPQSSPQKADLNKTFSMGLEGSSVYRTANEGFSPGRFF